MQKLRALISITRPVNVLIGIFSIFVGALITGTVQPLNKVLLACLAGGMIAAGSNAINDYFDLEIDRINKPKRPLPAGKLTRRTVYWFALTLFFMGSVSGFGINTWAVGIILLSVFLGYFYSARLKRTVLWGNLTVSLMTALAFIFGGVAVNRLHAALIPAGFSFLFHLGREIIKDAQDIEGDAANHIITLPIRVGKKPALAIANWIYGGLILATFFPYFFKIYGLYYLVVVLLGVDLVVSLALISAWRNPSFRNLGLMSDLLKADMLLGLAAIYLGRF
ncbi:geranylgeranylglycerol-phosphate geranylgeranyltransferase [candidate division KSB1 bacterium]|nr:geranylgeranylglycerol-phosphate geranylgeranyltransferase [candidate division KSB1 bacterium]